ncbi:MAG: aspartate kinase [FCB group bacterium]|nr:aspartate kinase [FCB group bacterium]MBL7028756.1 aspartate kinase [Candidatus Neomarinimicrobiota bacterium]MBL7121360.1 aspartate kinase [Candidatus Neomarinimicrobiota bacterium]
MKKILKFGGSSVANGESIRQVAAIIENAQNPGDEVFVVLSAMRGVTDALIEIAVGTREGQYMEPKLQGINEVHEEAILELGLDSDFALVTTFGQYSSQITAHLTNCPGPSIDFNMWKDGLLCYGELFSAKILSSYLKKNKIDAEVLDARKVVVTDSNYGNAYVHYQKSYDRIREYVMNRSRLQVITGFLGANEYGNTSTLGRSGSDYSASIFGAALNVDEIEIWTDVDGILTANPKLVERPISIAELTYEEAMELAHAGAKVIFPPTMIPALYKQIPITIKNTFNPGAPGSRISQNRVLGGEITVGLSSVSHVSMIRLQGAGMVGVKGINARLFTCLAEKGISVMLVSQAFSEHSTCFALKPDETEKAVVAIEGEFSKEFKMKYIDKIRVEGDLSLVAVVGEGMQTTPGIAGVIFEVLGRERINVEAIAQGSTKRNISFIVGDMDVKRAIQALHRRLFESV